MQMKVLFTATLLLFKVYVQVSHYVIKVVRVNREHPFPQGRQEFYQLSEEGNGSKREGGSSQWKDVSVKRVFWNWPGTLMLFPLLQMRSETLVWRSLKIRALFHNPLLTSLSQKLWFLSLTDPIFILNSCENSVDITCSSLFFTLISPPSCWCLSQAQVAFLQGERKGQENMKQDLVRRIKMLEYALKQERYVTWGERGSCFSPSPQFFCWRWLVFHSSIACNAALSWPFVWLQGQAPKAEDGKRPESWREEIRDRTRPT